ncbi:unnamed protein product [marine sediment metagenome]|uniref:Uncharacterized protein n=1 Tax=marine sediment metagenome TaxID=412755 RepID=X1HNN8_9ZZZZ
MDVRNWSMDQILMLPDHCFGRRWPVGVYADGVVANKYYDISEAGLGDRCVVWQAIFYTTGADTTGLRISLSLGDQMPADDAEFDALEPLFSDLGRLFEGRRFIDQGGGGQVISIPMRVPIQAQGRRLVGRFQIVWGSVMPPSAVIVVSSIPREVPDCLLSV